MLMFSTVILLSFVCNSIGFTARNLIPPPHQDTYEFWLVAKESQTMTITGPESTVLLWDKNGKQLMKRGEDFENKCGALEAFENTHDKVINTGDGRHRQMYALNGSIPGPILTVFQGSKVKVHLTNGLATKGLVLHFHGLKMTDNFWHDGSGKMSQCPIQPEETFTYSFVAENTGTFFYHGHFDDRGDGLEGAFIVLPKEDSWKVNSEEGPVEPDAQYVGFIQDWYPNLWDREFTYVKWGINKFYHGYENYDKCYAETKTFDGGRLGQVAFHSALINGRGWHNMADLLHRPHELPLENFHIAPATTIAIRFVNAGVLFPFVISIDDHDMEVVAADSDDIKPVKTKYLAIFPGERYVVLVNGKVNPDRRRFFIKMQSLEASTENFEQLPENHLALSYLKYTETPTELADEPQKPEGLLFEAEKASDTVSRIVNCPFKKFPRDYNINCVNLDQIVSANPAAPDLLGGEPDTTLFFNVFNDKTINGFRFAYPKAPPAMFPTSDSTVIKSCDVCRDQEPSEHGEPCKCTHFHNVTLGSTLRIVLVNREKVLHDPDDLDAFAHPMHIHGAHFHVLKVGYPEYGDNGRITKFNDDIQCPDDPCNHAEFNPDVDINLNMVNPPIKDTIAVPVGGYAVLQFKATNPGWFPLHCHMLPHHLDGMAVALKVGEYHQMPPVPEGFPRCFQNY